MYSSIARDSENARLGEGVIAQTAVKRPIPLLCAGLLYTAEAAGKRGLFVYAVAILRLRLNEDAIKYSGVCERAERACIFWTRDLRD